MEEDNNFLEEGGMRAIVKKESLEGCPKLFMLVYVLQELESFSQSIPKSRMS